MIPLVVVMGVAGSGKSSVGAALADRLGCPFVDGDDLHPAANVAKMASGTALDDGDRAPWLAVLNERLRAHHSAGEGAVLACSALTAAYRRRLAAGLDGVAFVYLAADRDLVERRLTDRSGHFMKASMVAGQFATLEEPGADEAVRIDAGQPIPAIVDEAFRALKPSEP